MAFPTVAGRQETLSAAATSHTVNLDTTPTTDDMLVCMLSFGFSGTDTTIGMPSTYGTWNLLDSELRVGAGANDSKSAVYYKTAAGEGTTLTVTSSTSAAMVSYVTRISAGTWTGTPEAASTGGNNFTYNPPNLTPTWGADDNLWIVFGGGSGGTTSISAAPANYTTNFDAGITGKAIGCYGDRTLNAASENPGAFTQDAVSSFGGAYTIAVQGASASFMPAAPRTIYRPAVMRAATW